MASFVQQVFVLGCLIGASLAAPVTKILEYDAGTHSRYEHGQPGQSVSGSYSWQDGDQVFTMDYKADENGYRPVMKVQRLGDGIVKIQQQPQQQPYLQQFFVPVAAPAAVQAQPAPIPVIPAAPIVKEIPQQEFIVQTVTKEVKPEPVPIKIDAELPKAEPAKVEEPVKVVEPSMPQPVRVEQPAKPEADDVDDAIQVTADSDAAAEPDADQIKGALLMNAIYGDYEQQLLAEQQYLLALAQAQQDNIDKPSSYSLTQEEEAELALLQMMQYEQELAKQVENKPDDQSVAVRLALEYEKQLARELEQQAYLRQLAEAQLYAPFYQPAKQSSAGATLRELIDYEQQQQLLAQLAGLDETAGYLSPEITSQAVDGTTVNARELSDYEKALEALYFGAAQ